MRQTILNLGLLAGFLAIGAPLAAEPVVGGYVLERLPGGKTAVVDGKNIVLAHIFNPDPASLKAGSYDIGVEVQGAKGVKTFVLKPNSDLGSGALRTYRVKVPLNADGKTGMVRVFARMDGRKIWSEALAGNSTATRKTSAGAVTTLYTEVPPEPAAGTPPKEVPFENEIGASRAPRTAGKTVPSQTPAITPKSGKQTSVAAVSAPAATSKPRVINPSEFRTLRTIDEELVIYVVKAGDTIQTVAERYYGNAEHVRTIADLNFIEAKAAVKPGEEIIVDVRPLSGSKPSVGKKETAKALSAHKTVAPSAAAVSVAGAEKQQGIRKYTVQNGDTLAIIAKRFYGKATKAGLIIKANPGLNPKNLKIGTELVVPAENGEQA